MESITLKPGQPSWPRQLAKMYRPPEQLYVAGDTLADILTKPRVAIVGSRQMSPYGQQVTAKLAGQLAERGVVVISGLALGVDACAQSAALQAGGQVVGVMPTPLDRIYPVRHQPLASRITRQGGVLLSSYAPGSESYKGNFVARNEIMAALSDAVVITEATTKSGSRHTARFAIDMGVPVLAVPGNITSPQSAGTNQLLKVPEATALTDVNDVLQALNLPGTQQTKPHGSTPAEQTVLDLIGAGNRDGAVLLAKSQLDTPQFNQTLTMLEITGKVVALGGNQWGLP